jgi:hypothetical protein
MDDFERNEHNEIVLNEDEGLSDLDIDPDKELNLPDEAQDLLDSVGQEPGKDLEGYLPTEKSDEEVLNEVGVDVQVDGSYDMATRQGREALAKDLHHEMRDVFVEIGLGSQEVIDAQADAYEEVLEKRGLTLPVTRAPWEVRAAGMEALNEKVKEIEEDVYNHLAVVGATEREIGEEEVYQAIARAATQYHVEVDRMEGTVSLEDLEGYEPETEAGNPYKDLDDLTA